MRTHTLHQKITVLTANLPLMEPLMEAAGYRVLAADHAAAGDDDGDDDDDGGDHHDDARPLGGAGQKRKHPARGEFESSDEDDGE